MNSIEVQTTRDRERLIKLALAAGIFIPILGSALCVNYLADWSWPNVIVHSLVEGLGGFIALAVAGVLLVLPTKEKAIQTEKWIACAFISMGILDIFHAGIEIGEIFVWFHSTAQFFGGFFIAFVWLSHKGRTIQFVERLPQKTIYASLVFAFISLLFPEIVPTMVRQENFTLFAKLLNIIGGVGFLIGAVFFILNFRKGGHWIDYIFIVQCALFGSAGVLFEHSMLWDGPWWWWHLLRIIAYGAALAIALISHINIQRNLQEFNKLLSRKVREARQETEAANQSRNLILNSAGEGICGLDTEGNLTFINPAAETMTGYTCEEVMGKNLHDLIHHSKADGTPCPWGKCSLYNTLKDGITHGEVEETFWRKDGTSFPVDCTHSLSWENETLIGVVLTIRDISERKKAEEQIKKAQKLLFRTEKLSSIGTLSAGVSHEILNPLNIINVIVQMELKKAPPARLKERFGKIKTQVERATKITNTLREFSRQGNNEITRLNIHQTFDTSASLIEHELNVENIVIERNFDEGLPEVEADNDKLAQVFLNLLNNAKDALQDAPDKKIIVKTKSLGKDIIEFRLSDTGPGIPEDDIDKIFDPFFTTKEPGKGTGLGLSIVHEIIEQAGGSLRVENGKNAEGAVFTIQLPIGNPPQENNDK